MKIDLRDDLRVVGTEHAWELQRRTVVKGQERWRPFKWFKTFGMAVPEAVHAEIRQHPAQALVEAIEAVDSIVQRYARLIPCEFELRRRDES